MRFEIADAGGCAVGDVRFFDPNVLPPAWIAVATHQRFGKSARQLAASMLFLSDEDVRLGAVFKDAGHYVAAMSATYLDAAGGLSISLLKQICAGSGFMSPNRARAIVEFLLHIGYLDPSIDDPANDAYRPTGRFLVAWRRHLQAALMAAAPLDPFLPILSDRLADADTFRIFLTVQASRLHAASRMPDPFPQLRQVFLHPLAGMHVLWALILAGTDDAFEPIGEFHLPLRRLASQFGVTDLHIRRLISHAQAEGFLTYHGKGRHSFKPGGLTILRYHFASQLSELIECGRHMAMLVPNSVVRESPAMTVPLIVN